MVWFFFFLISQKISIKTFLFKNIPPFLPDSLSYLIKKQYFCTYKI